MENLSIADVLSLQRSGRGYGYDDGYGYGCYHRSGRGMAATGIGLGAGLGGAALIGVFLAAWGANQASKARYKAAENAANGNTKAIELVAAHLAQERNTRESWQNVHTPTMTQYVDVRAGAGAGAGANALANAEAYALMNGVGLNPLSSVIQNNCALRVQRVSERNCGCGCDD